MMPHEPNRTARIEARIAPEALAVVKRAAELQGRSVSDFVVAAAQDAAARAIEETQIVRLSVEDQHAFVAAILDPPSPGRRTGARGRGPSPADPGLVVPGEFVIEPLGPAHNRKGIFLRRRGA